MKELTQKQEQFTLNLFKGMNQRESYIDAFNPTYAIPTIDANASILARHQKVLARLTELRQPAVDDSIATVEERKQRLTEITRFQPLPESINARDRVLAISELNKMEGSYAPVKHQVAKKVIFEVIHTPRLRATESTAEVIEGESDTLLLEEENDGQDSKGEDEALQTA